MTNMLAHIKRMAEVVGAVVVLYGAFAAVILAFGGNVPPWDTVAHAQSLEQAIKDETKQIKAMDNIYLTNSPSILRFNGIGDFYVRFERNILSI